MTATDRVAAIRVRLAAATPGQWYASGGGLYLEQTEEQRLHHKAGDPLIEANIYGNANFVDSDDAELIANAPADVAWLLAELDSFPVAHYRDVLEENARAENEGLRSNIETAGQVLTALHDAQQCPADEDGYVSHEVEDGCVRCHKSAYDIYRSGS